MTLALDRSLRQVPALILDHTGFAMTWPNGRRSMRMDALNTYWSQGWPNVQGWMDVQLLPYLRAIGELQLEANIQGHVAEIGVYHGKLFIALATMCRAGEKATAIDVFDDQSRNIDGAGIGDRDILLQNVGRYGPKSVDYAYIQADSSSLTILDKVNLVRDRGPFRVFSIDGCHTAEHTLNDLVTARDCLAPGGVIVLDDYMQPHWPGVTEAASIFCREAPRVVPFLYAHHKLFFVGVGWHAQYFRALSDKLIGYPYLRVTSMFGRNVVSIYP